MAMYKKYCGHSSSSVMLFLARQWRRIGVAALRTNGAQTETVTVRSTDRFHLLFLRISSSPSWTLFGLVSCSPPDKRWTYTRIMGIYTRCARPRGSIQP
ncbi:hypothetical protein PAMP_003417 [Pampus punctatissimus]